MVIDWSAEGIARRTLEERFILEIGNFGPTLRLPNRKELEDILFISPLITRGKARIAMIFQP
jgi:hypothetical protein